ncbi:hypothetical protein [Gluconacetobacter entanii]|uniref:Uncharacterized protein n=1 Tax=Gluconacetobacter entanii TaxID=108528 RepID=A0A318QFG7_9PROT|nr:hypothetical protein [Gluconacetobacter entanii]MCE2577130.1 hypothetical protein [Komagataeibacter sp. FNDCR1]PYD64717.1 hypothetical protein CFR72_00770 [Gluconacetobacter entanii]
MEYNFSYYSFCGISKADLLSGLGMQDTGTLDANGQYDFTMAQLPDHWIVFRYNNLGRPPAVARKELSRQGTLIACDVREGEHVCRVECYEHGVLKWSISHDGEAGDTLDLEVVGIVPPTFAPMRRAAFAAQQKADQAGEDAHYMYWLPLDFAASLTGYRYDREKFPWGTPQFTEIEPVIPTTF